MNNTRPDFDAEIQAIARYVTTPLKASSLAYETAYYTLLDSLACAIMALDYPACTRLLGPIVPGATLPQGTPIPGQDCHLDPIQAAFNLGTMIRWLDFNDTWLAAEWGHPSDNLGAILALTDYVSRTNQSPPRTVHDILTLMIKAHEIQGVLALENSFNRVGLDHVILVKVASTAVAAAILNLDFTTTCNALSHAWLDGHALRTYRHLPNTGPRKSWAAGDATSRAVRLALIASQGEIGYPSALTAPTWGFCDTLFRGKPLQRQQEYGCYVMENTLWKIAFPAEFHAQTAVECAIQLHPFMPDSIDDITHIYVETTEASMRIIDKSGPLHNPADRDHCLQYMIAIGLLFGELNANHYEDKVANDPRIDQLRERMHVTENPTFSRDYMAADKRAIGNSIQLAFRDGTTTDKITVEYPLGHRRRRPEGTALLMKKFKRAIQHGFAPAQADNILAICGNQSRLESTLATELMDMLATTKHSQHSAIPEQKNATE